MPKLIVLRHAKSDQHLGLPDPARPLNDRGRAQAPEAGRWLATHTEGLDLAVVSTAVRTRQTWQLVAGRLTDVPPVQFDAKVYNASLDDLLEVVRELPAEASTVLLVGHNPGVSELVGALTAEEVEMPTSAIAVVGLGAPWADLEPGTGRLLATGRPPATA